jgi:hypothetical protein
MKPGSTTLKNRQEVGGMASSKFSEVVVKATPLARKVMAAVFLGAEGMILEDIILHGKLVTQTCTFKHLKPSRSISGEFNLKSSIISTHDHTPKFKTTGSKSQNLDRLFFPAHVFGAHKGSIYRKRFEVVLCW